MMILVTAFDPFHYEATNASQLVLDELKTRVEIQTQIIPTSFHRCYPILRQAVASYKPDAVIMLGEAEDRPHISLERIAINLDDARIEDNDGVQLRTTPIEKKGPDGLFTRLPIDEMIADVSPSAVTVAVSNSAGTFVCNHIMYEALYHLPKSMPVGFIHVPILTEQGYETDIEFDKEAVVSTMVKMIVALKKRLKSVE
jgi:pyroglutamyl-peptidase